MAKITAAPSHISIRQKADFTPITLGSHQKAAVGVGVEFDRHKLQCAMVSRNSKGEIHIEALEQREGDFSRPEILIQNLKSCRDALPGNENESWSSCIHGGNSFVSQVEIAEAPDKFLLKKIKAEIEGKAPFELSRATIDFQEIPAAGSKPGLKSYIVAAVENSNISRHTNILQRSGISHFKLDMLALSLANALYLGHSNFSFEKSQIIVHLGSECCSYMAEGGKAPLFARTFKMGTTYQLIEEVIRLTGELVSKKHINKPEQIWLSGQVAGAGEWLPFLQSKLKVPVKPLNLSDCCGYSISADGPEFDLALSLAVRGLE